MNRGFTFVELVVVVLIIGILAAVGVPHLLGLTEEALIKRTITDVRAIHDAASLYLAEHGELPAQTEEGTGPGAFEGYIDGRVFNKVPPIGGIAYGWMKSWSNLDGLVYIDFGPNMPRDIILEMDQKYDDGNPGNKSIRIVSNHWAVFGLDEK